MAATDGKPGPSQARPAPVSSLDLTEVEVRFERALKRIHMHFQPIVTGDRKVFGYEALLRCDDPDWRGPGPILTAAERLNRFPKLGRVIRSQVAQVFADADPGRGLLFVNLHAVDLLDKSLASPFAPLARIAERVVLEITERASLENLVQVRNHVADLKQMGYRIAIDDLGAGAARMKDFAMTDTDFVKLDISVVRDIDREPMKQTFVSSILGLCHSQNILVIGEGVETADEARVLLDLGCDLLQGYYLARPGPPFPELLR